MLRTPAVKNSSLGLLAIVGFYLSGLFVWLTPLPIVYIFKTVSRLAAYRVAWVAGVILLAIYWGLLPWLGIEAFHAKLPFLVLPGEPFVWLGSIQAIFYLWMGLTLAHLEAKSLSTSQFFGQCLMSILILVVIVLGLLLANLGWSFLYQQAYAFVQSVMDELIRKQPAFQTHQAEIIRFTVLAAPSFFIIFALLLSVLQVWLMRTVLARYGFFQKLQEFKKIQWPFPLVWSVAGLFLVMIFNHFLFKVEIVDGLILNGLMIIGFIYFLQGLGVLSFYLNKIRMSFWLQVLAMGVAVLFLSPAAYLLIGVGFFDAWFDFRKLKLSLSAKE